MLTLQDNVFNISLVTSFSLVVHRLVHFVPPRQKNKQSGSFFSILTLYCFNIFIGANRRELDLSLPVCVSSVNSCIPVKL